LVSNDDNIVEANAGEAEKEVALGDKEKKGAAVDDKPQE
jgi:hypothetical protein